VLAVGILAGCSPSDPSGGSAAVKQPTPKTSTAPLSRASELTGGSLAVAPDGVVAIADADHHQLFLFDSNNLEVTGAIDLPGTPGRVVAMPNGKFQVAIRSTGEVATVTRDLQLTRRAACPEPSGITYDPSSAGLFVACGGGELMFLADDGHVDTLARADFPLRDVIVNSGTVQVTSLRTAQVFTLAGTPPAAQLVSAIDMPALTLPGSSSTWTPNTAWRTIPLPNGWAMVHQRAFDGVDGELTPPSPTTAPNSSSNSTNPYGGSVQLPSGVTCLNPVVRSSITIGDGSGFNASAELQGVLPVDVAVSPDGTTLAIAMAGSLEVRLVPVANLQGVSGVCEAQGPADPSSDILTPGAPDGVGFLNNGQLVTHVVRNGAHIVQIDPVKGAQGSLTTTKFLGLEVELEGGGARDLFHRSTNEMACASCHPMGHDDGHVWRLIAHTARTQSLAGGLLATAPFHWSGSLLNVASVMSETFVHRMGGTMPSDAGLTAMGKWLDGIPAVTHVSTASQDMINRGEELFHGAAACDSCHTGATFTNNLTLDIGTGGTFQVPSLRGVSERGPWMHDGCAATLLQRFNPACGGSAHGNLAALTDPNDQAALVAFLQTL